MLIKQTKDLTIKELKELIRDYELQKDELFKEEKRFLRELKKEMRKREKKQNEKIEL